ncbi:MAG: hypothetical protein JXM70_27430 [Pirellulales bacterium]|nr:hypothetical protein [Pirellulales bacterium]
MKSKQRLATLVCVGLFLILTALAILYLWFYRPIGSGPAGPVVDAGIFENTWTDRKVLLLGVGDSVTAGFGVSPDYSYVGRLVKNPGDNVKQRKKMLREWLTQE